MVISAPGEEQEKRQDKHGKRATGISRLSAAVSDSRRIRRERPEAAAARRKEIFFFPIPYLQGVDVGVDGVQRALGLGRLDERGGVGRADLLHAAGLGKVEEKEFRVFFFFRGERRQRKERAKQSVWPTFLRICNAPRAGSRARAFAVLTPQWRDLDVFYALVCSESKELARRGQERGERHTSLTLLAPRSRGKKLKLPQFLP